MGGSSMDFSLFLQEFAVLYFIAFIGYVATKTKILKINSEKVFMQVILYVTLPALIIYSMDFPLTNTIASHFVLLICLSIIALVFATILAYLLNKKMKLGPLREGVFQSLIIFGNQGFIGYAVLFLLFGEIGI